MRACPPVPYLTFSHPALHVDPCTARGEGSFAPCCSHVYPCVPARPCRSACVCVCVRVEEAPHAADVNAMSSSSESEGSTGLAAPASPSMMDEMVGSKAKASA